MSEIIAELASNSCSGYLPKTQWDDDNYNRDLVHDMSNLDNDLRKYEWIDDGQEYTVIPFFNFKAIVAWENIIMHDVWIKMYFDGQKDKYELVGTISLRIGNKTILALPIAVHAFFAKLVNTKVPHGFIVEEDGIKIPLVFFNLMYNDTCGHQFPLYALKNHSLEIGCNTWYRKCDLLYKKKPVPASASTTMDFSILQSLQTYKCNVSAPDYNTMACKCVLFMLYTKEVYDIPHVYKIELSLNNKSPIAWEDEKEEIIYRQVENWALFYISFCPELNSRQKLQKFFTKSPSTRGKQLRGGINFNRISNSKFTLFSDPPIDSADFMVVFFNTNTLRFCKGLGWLVSGNA